MEDEFDLFDSVEESFEDAAAEPVEEAENTETVSETSEQSADPATDAESDSGADGATSTESDVVSSAAEPSVEASPEVEDETVTISKTEFDELRKTLDELSAKVLESPAKLDKPNGATAPAGDAGMEEVNFIGDLDIDDVASRPELMNQVLNNVLRTAQETISQALVKALPALVQPTVRQTVAMDTAINKFYEEHSLLGNFRSVVGQVANQVQAANPEAALPDLLPKIAQESYKVLKINPNAVAAPRAATASTGLPRSGGSARPAAAVNNLSDQEQQILDLLG